MGIDKDVGEDTCSRSLFPYVCFPAAHLDSAAARPYTSPRLLWSRQRVVAVPWASERKRRICNYSPFPTASSLPQRPLSSPPSSPCVSSSLSFRSRAPTLIFMLLHDWDAEESVARSWVILLFLLCYLPVSYLHHLFFRSPPLISSFPLLLVGLWDHIILM